MRTGRRPSGGVSITEMSRRPASDICSVRGIGVAESESTSTLSLSWRSSSFCLTPKRCSSSTITSPSSFARTSRESSRWVPIRISTRPSANRFSASRTSAGLRSRETISISIGNSASRSRKVPRCCWARIVVGTRIITCLPSAAALCAARSATSVLP